jgi:hypothetical protein
MLKLALATILVSGLVSVGPSFAAANSSSHSSIGRGCTLDPFTKTMRCIDFDNCKLDKNGRKVCPVVVTPMQAAAKKSGGKKGDKQQYYVVTLEDAMITG